MEINGLLAKVIFDKNTNREFYVEESFPLDWMYPYLEPHGLIMKINRQPLPELSDEIVHNDSDYWEKYVTPMIGGWLNHDTTSRKSPLSRKKFMCKKILADSPATRSLFRMNIRAECFPNCGVPSPGFMPGARSMPLTPVKKSA